VKKIYAMIQDSGRGCYVLVVGKLNLPKLANFGEIDSYVLLGCPEFVIGILENSRDFHVPVITPFELSVVLEKREWDGFWSADFGALELDEPRVISEDENGEIEDEPYFSLATGKYEIKKNSYTKVQHAVGGGQMIEYRSEGANALEQREYRGLVTDVGGKELSKAIDGQMGIASDYGLR